MTITWLGHSCFLLESNGYRVLLDPFKGVPGLPDIACEADAVYCSHGHFDHAYTEHVVLTAGKENPFTVGEIAAFHDDQGGKLRGANTIRRFTADGVTVVHLGDLGHQLSGEQVQAIAPCDVLLLPVGGTYTLGPAGAKLVVEALRPRIVVPMHYRKGEMGFDILATAAEFLDLCPDWQVCQYEGATLTVDAGTPAQIAVLRPEI